MNALDSKCISFLRFPLILGVVCIHAQFPTVNFWGNKLQMLLGEELGRISVPMFLLISGYLFFKEYPHFLKRDDYLGKIKSRCRSLLVPYLLWNLIAYIVYAAQYGFSFADFVHAFWVADIPGRSGSSPMDGPLWYIRNLMILVVIAPFITLLLKYTRWYILLIMGGMWLFQISVFTKGLGIAFFFFSFGGYLRIYKKSVCDIKYGIAFVIFYLLYLLFAVYTNSNKYNISTIGILLGGYSILYLSKLIVRTQKDSYKIFHFLSNSSFFIYCSHDIILPFVKSLCFKHIYEATWGDYLDLVIMDVLLCLLLYALTKKYLPTFCNVLMGSR